jgi:hypothetical protein
MRDWRTTARCANLRCCNEAIGYGRDIVQAFFEKHERELASTPAAKESRV